MTNFPDYKKFSTGSLISYVRNSRTRSDDRQKKLRGKLIEKGLMVIA